MTDLYQLTMAAGYFMHKPQETATFELFVRRLPANRSYLVVAGMAEALDYLTQLRFDPADLEYLQQLPQFKHVPTEFFNYLRDFRFTGDVWAMPEGTLAFANEPLVRVTAPLIAAQLVETFLLAVVNFQTLIATKASRIVQAAQADGQYRSVLEFGTRRAHGPVAGVWAARAAYLAGCTGTSNLAAGARFGIPVFGTAAHAWTMAFDSEAVAFSKFYQLFPESTTLLIDTYDTLQGAHNATQLGAGVKAVRIDSGDFVAQAKAVRQILDAAGMTATKIVISGDLNEHTISQLLAAQTPVDSFGVGTELVTSRDIPALGGVYKMVERVDASGQHHYTVKLSAQKTTYPGTKQVFRQLDAAGHYHQDIIALADEPVPPNSVPLLVPMLRQGQLTAEATTAAQDLTAARERVATSLKQFPAEYQRLAQPTNYPVTYSDQLQALLATVRQQHQP
jgi:nicotinate phosphoribosyltransferase